MKRVNNTELLTCFFLTTLLCGCAYNTPIPYQSFEHFEIMTPDSRTSLGAIPSRSESAATGAAAGAFGGLTVSFLASLICGPYFAVCFATTAPVTIGATTMVGGVLGMSGISDEDAAKIVPYLEALQATHNMNQDLTKSLAEKLPVSSFAPPGVADSRIILDVNSVRLMKGPGQDFVFSVSVAIRFEWGLHKPGPQHSTRTFRCDTRSRAIDEWVDDGGAIIEQELNYCIEDLALQINKVLTKPPPRTAVGFSEIDT